MFAVYYFTSIIPFLFAYPSILQSLSISNPLCIILFLDQNFFPSLLHTPSSLPALHISLLLTLFPPPFLHPSLFRSFPIPSMAQPLSRPSTPLPPPPPHPPPLFSFPLSLPLHLSP